MLGYCQLGDGNGSGPKQLDAAKFVVVLFFLMILLVGAAGELPLLFPFLVFFSPLNSATSAFLLASTHLLSCSGVALKKRSFQLELH